MQNNLLTSLSCFNTFMKYSGEKIHPCTAPWLSGGLGARAQWAPANFSNAAVKNSDTSPECQYSGSAAGGGDGVGDCCCCCVLLQVFALGNKTYEHYNAMGKYVDKRLEELGATRIFDLGLGDDDGK